MELSLEKKAHVFRLPSFLIDKLKDLAQKDHRSLNNEINFGNSKVTLIKKEDKN